MNWIVLVLGLSSQPTFHQEYSFDDCSRRVEHINHAYGDMVHARCITVPEAKRLGWNIDHIESKLYK